MRSVLRPNAGKWTSRDRAFPSGDARRFTFSLPIDGIGGVDAFKATSTRGMETPKPELDLITERL